METKIALGAFVTALAMAGAAASTAIAAAPHASAAGRHVFETNCAGCHGATGMGLAGAFPPLAGNDVVTGDHKKLIAILNNGLNGPIEVKGAKYNGQMPAWKGNLTPKQIADVATYIRNAWGNKADAITEAEVK